MSKQSHHERIWFHDLDVLKPQETWHSRGLVVRGPTTRLLGVSV
jgi:hypothetical protein